MDEKIEKIEKIGSSSGAAKAVPVNEPDRAKFEGLMSKDVEKQVTVPEHVEAQTKKSLMDEVREIDHQTQGIKRASPTELVEQAEKVIGNIESLKERLANPDLQIKHSARSLLRNKLLHIDDSLKIALEKAGVEYKAPPGITDLSNPMDRFLGLLSNSQYQLENLASEVKTMHANREEWSPASMLLVQIKVTQVSQQLEFFTNMLNKALESTKTIMNVQV